MKLALILVPDTAPSPPVPLLAVGAPPEDEEAFSAEVDGNIILGIEAVELRVPPLIPTGRGFFVESSPSDDEEQDEFLEEGDGDEQGRASPVASGFEVVLIIELAVAVDGVVVLFACGGGCSAVIRRKEPSSSIKQHNERQGRTKSTAAQRRNAGQGC